MAVIRRHHGDRAGPMSHPGALVLGADIRALGIARSLGRRGVETWVLRRPGEDPVACHSRYVRRSLDAPVGRSGEQAGALLALADRHDLHRWSLFATDDEPVAALAQRRDELADRFALTFPGWRTCSSNSALNLKRTRARLSGVVAAHVGKAA